MNNSTTTIEARDPHVEADLIRLAQQGDEGAKSRLVAAYLPAIEAAAARITSPTFEYDDAFQEACVAFLHLVEKYDVSRSPVLATYVRRELDYRLRDVATSTTNPFGIPAATFRKYLRAMKEADGDLVLAASLVKKHGMSLAVFLDIYRAVGAVSLNRASFEGDGEENVLAHSRVTVLGRPEDEEDAYDSVLTSWEVRSLMEELDDESLEVVRIAYGFEPAVIDGEEVEELTSDKSLAAYDDGTVAAAMTWRHGTTYSRQKVQRRRTAALKTMREKYATNKEAE